MKLLLAALIALCLSAPAWSEEYDGPSSITITKVCPDLIRYFEKHEDGYDEWNAGQCMGYVQAVIETLYLLKPGHLCTEYRTLADGTVQRILTNEQITSVVRYLEGIGADEDPYPSAGKLMQALEANFLCEK